MPGMELIVVSKEHRKSAERGFCVYALLTEGLILNDEVENWAHLDYFDMH